MMQRTAISKLIDPMCSSTPGVGASVFSSIDDVGRVVHRRERSAGFYVMTSPTNTGKSIALTTLMPVLDDLNTARC